MITRGSKGAISIFKDKVTEVGVERNLKIVDLTGAGDLFAAGFLHGHINNLTIKDCLQKGTELSSKIIQQIGARLNSLFSCLASLPFFCFIYSWLISCTS